MAFAMDSSTILPEHLPLFKIQSTMPETENRSQKTAAEFGEAFTTLLRKRSNRVTIHSVHQLPGDPGEDVDGEGDMKGMISAVI